MPYEIESSALTTGKIAVTDDGGLAIKLTNKTGAASIKGYIVTPDLSVDNAVRLATIDGANGTGVFIESDIADGDEAWVVVAGIADVYYSNAPTRGYLARTGLTADTGEVAGQAISEAYPVSPFTTDKHFCEIGHCLETKAEAGLAKTILHFN